MKLWMRKLFVVFVTVMTFGTIVPQIPVDAQSQNSNSKPKYVNEDTNETVKSEDLIEEPPDKLLQPEPSSWKEIASSISAKEQLVPIFTTFTVTHANEVAKLKFGKAIEDVIGEEFRQVILPKIEEVLATYASTLEEDYLRKLAISEKPTGGLGEKIFHVYNEDTDEDVLRFHVRRDHPPMDGYWFNFHYHTYLDNFQTHQELGAIYWNKNTPPKWMN